MKITVGDLKKIINETLTKEPCPQCKGRGYKREYNPSSDDYEPIDCEWCDATGVDQSTKSGMLRNLVIDDR